MLRKTSNSGPLAKSSSAGTSAATSRATATTTALTTNNDPLDHDVGQPGNNNAQSHKNHLEKGGESGKRRGKFANVKSRFKLFYIEQVRRQKRIEESDRIKREELIQTMIQSGCADQLSLTASSSSGLFSPVKKMTFEEKKMQKLIDPFFQSLKEKYAGKLNITPHTNRSACRLSLDDIPTNKYDFADFLSKYFKSCKLYNPRLPRTVDYLKHKPRSLLQPFDIQKSLLLNLNSNIVLKSISMRTRARKSGDESGDPSSYPNADDVSSIKTFSSSSSSDVMSMYRLPPVNSPNRGNGNNGGYSGADEKNVTEADLREYMSLVGSIDEYDIPSHIWEYVVALEGELEARSGYRRASKLPQLVDEGFGAQEGYNGEGYDEESYV